MAVTVALTVALTVTMALTVAVTMTLGATSQCSKPAMSAAVRVAYSAGIATCPDAFSTEDVVQRSSTVGTGMDPALDGFEHGPVSVVAHVPEGGVVEDTHAVLQDLVLGDVGVLPCVQDAGCNVLQDRGGDLAGRFIEDVGKVVLGEQRVGGIGAARVGPGLVLMLARGVDDTGGTSLQGLGCGIDQWADKRCQQGHDEYGESLGDLLNNSLQAGDFLND